MYMIDERIVPYLKALTKGECVSTSHRVLYWSYTQYGSEVFDALMAEHWQTQRFIAGIKALEPFHPPDC